MYILNNIDVLTLLNIVVNSNFVFFLYLTYESNELYQRLHLINVELFLAVFIHRAS